MYNSNTPTSEDDLAVFQLGSSFVLVAIIDGLSVGSGDLAPEGLWGYRERNFFSTIAFGSLQIFPLIVTFIAVGPLIWEADNPESG